MLAILILAFSLSADAFAASIAKGARFRDLSLAKALAIALAFGLFEALAPLVGYLLGLQFQSAIDAFDHWVAFGLLGALGLRMIWKSFQDEQGEVAEAAPSFGSVLVVAAGTSIDATLVGVTLALLAINIALTLATIGVVTFAMCLIGLRLGGYLGARTGSWAEFLGGLGLIAIGGQIFLSHVARHGL